MIAPRIMGVYVVDVSADADIGRHRATKHCVCVSVGRGKYLVVNTSHRDIYDDFMLSASDYGFLKGTDRFLACHRSREFVPAQLIRDVGTLTVADAETVIAKVGASGTIPCLDRSAIAAELKNAIASLHPQVY